VAYIEVSHGHNMFLGPNAVPPQAVLVLATELAYVDHLPGRREGSTQCEHDAGCDEEDAHREEELLHDGRGHYARLIIVLEGPGSLDTAMQRVGLV